MSKIEKLYRNFEIKKVEVFLKFSQSITFVNIQRDPKFGSDQRQYLFEAKECFVKTYDCISIKIKIQPLFVIVEKYF